MFRRAKNLYFSSSKDASRADYLPPASPPDGNIQPRTRMSDRVFRHHRRALTDTDIGRSAFFRKMHTSPRTSDEQYRSQRVEVTMTDRVHIPAHPAIRPTRQPMEPRDPGYEDYTLPGHSRQKSTGLDKTRTPLPARHEALKIHKDPSSQADATSARGHHRPAQSFSGHHRKPTQNGEGALSHAAVAAAAAAQKRRGVGGTHSTRTSREDESARAASAKRMRVPMQSGRGRLVMISARSSGSERAEDHSSSQSAMEESGVVVSRAPDAEVQETQAREKSKASRQTPRETIGAPGGPKSGASHQGKEGKDGAANAMLSSRASSRRKSRLSRTFSSKLRVQTDEQAREDSETLPGSESAESSSDTRTILVGWRSSKPASDAGATQTATEASNVTSSSATPENVTGDGQPDGGYELVLDDRAGPSSAQVPRSTPADASELDVDQIASSLGAVTLQHHPELAVDHTRHEREPVVHEENRTHIHTIYEPQRTRSFHFHERRDIIQPIIDPEPTVLPAQHWMKDPQTGEVFKIPDELGRQLMESGEMETSGPSK